MGDTDLPSAATPVFTPGPGTYTGPIEVEITSATPGAVIFFTTDGTNPNVSSATYAGPLTVTSTTAIKALARSPASEPSEIATAIYKLNAADAAASD